MGTASQNPTIRLDARRLITSPTARSTTVALPCALLLHFIFPQTNMPWLAPAALAGLFAAWMMVSPKTAAVIGYFAGLVFCIINGSWFGETAGRLMGAYGFVIVVGPAAFEALAFALTAVIVSLATHRLTSNWVPFVAASGFTMTEILRSTGVFGLPMYQIGSAFVETPLAAILAFGGVYGITFIIALFAAGFAMYLIEPTQPNLVRVTIVGVAVSLMSIGAWMNWPARTLTKATIRVAAVQANLRQSVFWDSNAVPIAVQRYSAMTRSIKAFHPQFVLWPETVITMYLKIDEQTATVPANAKLVASANILQAQFGSLARELNTELAVGSNEFTPTGSHNDLFFFGPNGKLQSTYRKRQLVPFAEFLPGPSWLRKLPFSPLISNMSRGADIQPLGPLRSAPLICWDADFGELTSRDAARGADFFAVATDDAWFGTSDGPYAQAQIVQLRAIETGRWIVRAATTGVSGIVAPNGRWQSKSKVGTQDIVTGTIGQPLPTVYENIGPMPITFAFTFIGVAGFIFGRKRNHEQNVA